MNDKSLVLRERFDNIISSRAAIKNLFNFNINALKEINIDFSDITFISSSAAHQLVLELKKMEKLNVEVYFLNIDEDVQRMINIAKTDRKNIFTMQPVQIIDAPNDKVLNQLLL